MSPTLRSAAVATGAAGLVALGAVGGILGADLLGPDEADCGATESHASRLEGSLAAAEAAWYLIREAEQRLEQWEDRQQRGPVYSYDHPAVDDAPPTVPEEPEAIDDARRWATVVEANPACFDEEAQAEAGVWLSRRP